MSDVLVQIAGTRVLTIDANDDAGNYRILIAEPDGPPPPQGFPAIYALDGASVFGTFVDAVRMRGRRPDATGVAPSVIVGVEHAGPAGIARARRTRDFTPGPPVEEAGDTVPGAETGGAARFLAFLEGRVMAEVGRFAPVDKGRQALFGHSLGGMFTLWAFAQPSALFHSYIAVSPSIWWDPKGLIAGAARRVMPTGDPIGVMLTVGQFEQARAPWQPDSPKTEDALRRRVSRRMVDRVHEVAAVIEAAGARVECHEFAGEDHASVVTLSVARCLRFALAPVAIGG